MPALPRSAAALVALAGLGVFLAAGQGTQALFSSTAASGGNDFTAAPDLRAPTASPSLVSKATGFSTGYIKQGATYHVYANVSDAGSPASGTATVSADVSAIGAGQTAVPLSAGSYSAGGTSFNYRSAALSADNPLAAGPRGYTLTLTDAAGNQRAQVFSVEVDNTAPTGTDIQTADGNGDPGEPGTGDQVVFTFSEPMDPDSILSGWTGAATTVTVRIRDGGVVLGLLGDDELEIRNATDTATLPFGTVDLNAGGYSTGLLGGYSTWAASTMAMSGSQVTVTLGTHLGLATGEGGCCPQMQWPTQASPTDRAGNGTATGTVTETGADEDF